MYRKNMTKHSPILLEGRRVSEIVFPVSIKTIHERGESAAVMLAQTWQLPVRLVHADNLVTNVDLGLESLADRLRHRYPLQEFKTTHLNGEGIGRSICETVKADSLVFMSTQNANEWKVEGSTAEEVLRCGGVPLLMMGPNASFTNLEGEIVIGLDGSAPAEVSLALAKGLSEMHGNRIWLVTVVAQPRRGDPLMHRPQLVKYLEDRAAELGGLGHVGWEIIQSNDPVGAIEAFARNRSASLIIAGSRDRSDPSRQTMGSITMGLVSKAQQPVLAAAATPPPMALGSGRTERTETLA